MSAVPLTHCVFKDFSNITYQGKQIAPSWLGFSKIYLIPRGDEVYFERLSCIQILYRRICGYPLPNKVDLWRFFKEKGWTQQACPSPKDFRTEAAQILQESQRYHLVQGDERREEGSMEPKKGEDYTFKIEKQALTTFGFKEPLPTSADEASDQFINTLCQDLNINGTSFDLIEKHCKETPLSLDWLLRIAHWRSKVSLFLESRLTIRFENREYKGLLADTDYFNGIAIKYQEGASLLSNIHGYSRGVQWTPLVPSSSVLTCLQKCGTLIQRLVWAFHKTFPERSRSPDVFSKDTKLLNVFGDYKGEFHQRISYSFNEGFNQKLRKTTPEEQISDLIKDNLEYPVQFLEPTSKKDVAQIVYPLEHPFIPVERVFNIQCIVDPINSLILTRIDYLLEGKGEKDLYPKMFWTQNLQEYDLTKVEVKRVGNTFEISAPCKENS